jgi:hypothetical protein
MMKGSLKIGAAVLLALGALSASARAQAPAIRQVVTDNTAYGTTSAEFLLIPATARGSALGSSYAALANDLGSMYYNPAGLALMDRAGVMASTMSYLAGTKYAYGAFGVPFGGGSRAIGFSVTTFGFSNQPVYTVDDPQGTSGQVYSVRETAVAGTFSQQFSDRFSAGMSVKFINDQLGDVSGQAFATLAGRAIRAAFVISNLGTNLRHTGSPLDVLFQRQPPAGQDQVPQEDAKATLQTKDWNLPVTFRVALAYDAFATSMSRLTVLGEFNQPNNSQPGYSFAGEYNLALGQSGFALAGRLGMTYAADDNMTAPGSTDAGYAGFDTTKKNQQYRISAGGGLRYAKNGFGIGFDYAYRSYGLLGGVNMLGVSLNW